MYKLKMYASVVRLSYVLHLTDVIKLRKPNRNITLTISFHRLNEIVFFLAKEYTYSEDSYLSIYRFLECYFISSTHNFILPANSYQSKCW